MVVDLPWLLTCAVALPLRKHRSRVLDNLLLDNDAKYKDYGLLFVGHSLGAAAAALCATFLRPKFPKARAIAFEPPGCTVSMNLAEESEAWCTSFVTGMDVIPRFGSEAFNDLRMEVLVNIARIKVPKHVVMANRSIDQFGADAAKEFLSEALHDPSEIPITPFLESVAKFFQYTKPSKSAI